MCGRNACIYFAAVYSFPYKIIVRKTVSIVPSGHFIRDKIVHSAFFQYLRKYPTVTENIRQPAIVYGFSEILPEKQLPVKALPY